MGTVVIAAVITFVITATWQKYAVKKNNANIKFLVAGLINELNDMAQEQGYEDWGSYLVATKGLEYADKAAQNMINTYEYLG